MAKGSCSPRAAFLAIVAAFPWVAAGLTQDPDLPPEFLVKATADPIAKLSERLGAGASKLVYEPRHGNLTSLLKELDLSIESQVLVFSKTSLQFPFISPRTPRAVYFNDRTYVGWIPGAPLIEIVGVDPQTGPVFYTLENRPGGKLTRQTFECFQCHASAMTGQVPGLMARSVFAGPDGVPKLAGGSFVTTARSPMKERWGGWYVTGTHGAQRHMGNEPARGEERSPTVDQEKGANITDLSRYLDLDAYLSPHSDIVALMVAEQQMTIQNAITKAGSLTRRALADAKELLKLKFEGDYVAEQTRRRIQNACEPVVLGLLCFGEPALEAPIKGTSGFTGAFAASAPSDKLGRRLSQLDLKTRLLRYPCSPMIYSASFAGLPEEARKQIIRRLDDVLSGKDATAKFDTMSPSDRQAVRVILAETLPSFSAGR